MTMKNILSFISIIAMLTISGCIIGKQSTTRAYIAYQTRTWTINVDKELRRQD